MTAIHWTHWRVRSAASAARAWLGLGLLVGLAACGGGGGDGSAAGSGARVGSFTAVASMQIARTLPSSAVLADGRVLVAGGFGVDGRPVASVEIFNPATGQWAAGPAMAATRAGDFLVRLNDGRVLALGSSNSEVYSPATQQWSPIATPPGALSAPYVVLSDGRVLALSLAGPQAHVYDPAANRWVSYAGFDGRRDFGTVRMVDGRVLVSGGRLGTVRTDTTLIFNAANGQWQAGPRMNVARMEHFSFVLDDGRIVVSHGVTDSPTVRGSTEVYDPASGRWTLAGDVIKFSASTTGATCTPLGGGRVLVAGGRSAAGGTVLDQEPQGQLDETNAEIFDPQTLQWRRATAPRTGLIQPRYDHTAARLGDGRVLVIGGNFGGFELAGAEHYNP